MRLSVALTPTALWLSRLPALGLLPCCPANSPPLQCGASGYAQGCDLILLASRAH